MQSQQSKQLAIETILCKCGCGTSRPIKDKWGKPMRFIFGHYARTIRRKYELILCACGCGNTRISKDNKGRPLKFINHHGCGHYKRSEETKAKISASLKGKHLSEETKAKISASNMGRTQPPRDGKNNGYWKGDELFKRTCVQCQSKNTRFDKGNNRPLWYKNKEGNRDGFVCFNCYNKNYNKTRIQ